MSSVVRAAAPSWLKIKQSYYFCASVSMSVLPSLPSCITFFLCFTLFAALVSLPYLSFVVWNTRKGFVSTASSSAVTPVWLQCVTSAKGTFPSMKPTPEPPPYHSKRERTSRLVSATNSQKTRKGQFTEKVHTTFISVLFPGKSGYMERLCQSCCSSSPKHNKAVKAEKHSREITHGW